MAAVKDSEAVIGKESELLGAIESVSAEREAVSDVLSAYERVTDERPVGVPAVSDADADSCAVNELVLSKLEVLLTSDEAVGGSENVTVADDDCESVVSSATDCVWRSLCVIEAVTEGTYVTEADGQREAVATISCESVMS